MACTVEGLLTKALMEKSSFFCKPQKKKKKKRFQGPVTQSQHIFNSVQLSNSSCVNIVYFFYSFFFFFFNLRTYWKVQRNWINGALNQFQSKERCFWGQLNWNRKLENHHCLGPSVRKENTACLHMTPLPLRCCGTKCVQSENLLKDNLLM